MIVREDFAERVEALSSSTPRVALSNLLSALMPRVAAKTRAPSVEEFSAEYARAPQPLEKLQKRRAPRMRAVGNRHYDVLVPLAPGMHRGWTRVMLECIVAATGTAGARAVLRDVFPEHADRNIDFNWAAARGYIKFI
jgi:hypothetical protein